jgi:hypothetical protein
MKTIRAISSLVLAMLVLTSSTSFMVGMHLCQGEIQNIALFSKADACEQEQKLPPCHAHQTAPCCEDEAVIHNSDDFNATVSGIQITEPAPLEIEQPPVLISEIIPVAPDASAGYFDYDPPLPSDDLTVRHRVFRI